MKKNSGNTKPGASVVPFPDARARAGVPSSPPPPSLDKRPAVARTGAAQRLRAHRPSERP